ncbi:MAG: Na+-transporting NADH:ubiquinone oxidoreductase subunit C [Motiliproteus sp.]|jgi:Na+-transporting NADH:ubiquinone oxidoreductase subunit C
MSANNDSISKTLIVTISLCAVCAVLVSVAAVGLKPLQVANKELDKKTNVLAAAHIDVVGKDINALFDSSVVARVLDLQTNTWADDIDPTKYDARKAVKDTSQAVILTPDEDVADIKRHARYKTLYMVKNGDAIETLILPVHGYGLWSTLYGFIALEGDLNTVVGLGFYSHAETPGLGGEVDNPRWKALWPGKKVYAGDNTEHAALTLIKGQVNPASEGAINQVDGLAGATLTSNGVSNLVEFWLSEDGYSPFLAKLRKGEV